MSVKVTEPKKGTGRLEAYALSDGGVLFLRDLQESQGVLAKKFDFSGLDDIEDDVIYVGIRNGDQEGGSVLLDDSVAFSVGELLETKRRMDGMRFCRKYSGEDIIRMKYEKIKKRKLEVLETHEVPFFRDDDFYTSL